MYLILIYNKALNNRSSNFSNIRKSPFCEYFFSQHENSKYSHDFLFFSASCHKDIFIGSTNFSLYFDARQKKVSPCLININWKVSQIYCHQLYFSHINCRPKTTEQCLLLDDGDFYGVSLIWNQVQVCTNINRGILYGFLGVRGSSLLLFSLLFFSPSSYRNVVQKIPVTNGTIW